MEIKTLYRYERNEGKITVALEKPQNKNHTETYRIIASKNKLVTKDGVNLFKVIDVDNVDDWYEVDNPNAETEW